MGHTTPALRPLGRGTWHTGPRKSFLPSTHIQLSSSHEIIVNMLLVRQGVPLSSGSVKTFPRLLLRSLSSIRPKVSLTISLALSFFIFLSLVLREQIFSIPFSPPTLAWMTLILPYPPDAPLTHPMHHPVISFRALQKTLLSWDKSKA